jgi:hypothetical protein
VCGYSVLASPLRHGDMVALLASLVVASGAMLLLGLVLERRWLRPKQMSLAFTIGDPALAVAIASGVRAMGPHQPCGVIGSHWQMAVALTWLIFGLWQWRGEVSSKTYTLRQALSPTKIWHQLIIYPALGTWSFVAIAGGLLSARRNAPAVAVMIVCLAIWIGTYVHNVRHPRLGHPPYSWRHLRPDPQPWGQGSSTLRSTLQCND